jgi:hypothetical protein
MRGSSHSRHANRRNRVRNAPARRPGRGSGCRRRTPAPAGPRTPAARRSRRAQPAGRSGGSSPPYAATPTGTPGARRRRHAGIDPQHVLLSTVAFASRCARMSATASRTVPFPAFANTPHDVAVPSTIHASRIRRSDNPTLIDPYRSHTHDRTRPNRRTCPTNSPHFPPFTPPEHATRVTFTPVHLPSHAPPGNTTQIRSTKPLLVTAP